MFIVGELINASRKSIETAIEAQDGKAIQKVAKNQFEAGANYIDVNAGVLLIERRNILNGWCPRFSSL